MLCYVLKKMTDDEKKLDLVWAYFSAPSYTEAREIWETALGRPPWNDEPWAQVPHESPRADGRQQLRDA